MILFEIYQHRNMLVDLLNTCRDTSSYICDTGCFIPSVFFFLKPSDSVVITVQAFLQNNEVVPLSMTHQSLYVNVETQVAIAGVILAGVYVLIIFEVNCIPVLLLRVLPLPTLLPPSKYLLIRELCCIPAILW